MKRTLKVALVALFALALVLPVFAAPNRQAADDGVVRIGVFQPLTGANAAGGQLELRGVQLAHELNPTVVIGGRTYRVELIIHDNRSDRTEAANIAERFVSQDRVNVVLGSWGSSLSMPAGEVFNRERVPAIALSATNPLVTRGNDW